MIIKDGILMKVEKQDIVNGEMKIPKGIREIAPAAFLGRVDLKRILIPEGVEKIGDMAFFMCRNLSLVKIADSVTEIGVKAFALCSKLRCVSIPEHVKLDAYAFKKCYRLSGVYSERQDMEMFNTNAFAECNCLDHIYKHIREEICYG